MRDFVDRVAGQPNRYKITPEGGGEPYFVTIERADIPSIEGTVINRNALMALQGFAAGTTSFPSGMVAKKVMDNGDTLEVYAEEGGSILKVFTGKESGQQIRQRISFNADGTIREEVV